MPVIQLTAGIATPHEIESCYGSPLHCHWHNIDEPANNAFRVCFECGHVYASGNDLLAAWSEQWESSGESWVITDANAVPGCAFCAHDW